MIICPKCNKRFTELKSVIQSCNCEKPTFVSFYDLHFLQNVEVNYVVTITVEINDSVFLVQYGSVGFKWLCDKDANILTALHFDPENLPLDELLYKLNTELKYLILQ